MKTTHLLNDNPALADEFGTHQAIAELIENEIVDSVEGRSIALVGDWGSGKSTVIELFQRQVSQREDKQVHLFLYDAWSHQGDSLRRAFLDDFIKSLESKMSPEEFSEASDQIWNRTETTKVVKEPILRPHAKIILLSLALVPFGFKILDFSTGDPLSELFASARNIFAVSLLLFPILLTLFLFPIKWFGCQSLKQFAFGKDSDSESFSVLNFFFEKVEGHIERKQIKAPIDSISAFGETFKAILKWIYARSPDLRIVIVLDNIDRIPSDQAREFWSTMQTFFSNTGGIRREANTKYWLVAPFSEQALSFIFRDGAETDHAKLQTKIKAKAYIDKTFGLAFYVPSPMFAHWRKYLFDQLIRSFPDHEKAALIAVRDAYDIARGNAAVTPRSLKIFINNLVVLYRQHGERISLLAMAIYVLKRDKISNDELEDTLLTSGEQALLDEADWRVPIAALHFGVDRDQATQLLLQEPILQALREGAEGRIQELSKRHGFVDVLQRAAAVELDVHHDDGATLTRVAKVIGSLDNANALELSGIWRSLRRKLERDINWQDFASHIPTGIKSVLLHCPATEKKFLTECLAKSLSSASLKEPDGDFQMFDFSAKTWIEAVRELGPAIATNDIKISIPGGKKLKLEILQQLTQLEMDELRLFKLELTADELSNAIADQITAGSPLRVHASLVFLLANGFKLNLSWKAIIGASEVRLRSPQLSHFEIESTVNLMLASKTIGSDAKALGSLKKLSEQGHLSHLLYLARKHDDARTSLLLATILSNPSFDRPTSYEQSAHGDDTFNSILRDAKANEKILNGIVELVIILNADQLLFDVGSTTSKIEQISSAVFGAMARKKHKLRISPTNVIEQRSYLERYEHLNPLPDFLQSLQSLHAAASLLRDQGFQIENSAFYVGFVLVARDENLHEFLDFLIRGVLGVISEDWSKALRGEGEHAALTDLAQTLKSALPAFELSVATRDGALNLIRETVKGGSLPDEIVRDRLAKLVALLSHADQISLSGDLLEDMMGSTESVVIASYIEIAGDVILLSSAQTLERVVRRVFGPIIMQPTIASMNWMAKEVARNAEAIQQISSETLKEFEFRFRSSSRNMDALPPEIVESFAIIAGLLQISSEMPPKADM